MRIRWFILGFGAASLLAAGWSVAASQESGFVRRLNLPGRTDDRPYSHTVVAGRTVYIAGSIGMDPKTNAVPKDPMEEARLALDAMKAKLALAGGEMDDLVSVQVFCSDLSLYGDFNELYATYFDDKAPVRAFVGTGPLLFGARFEVTGIAVLE